MRRSLLVAAGIAAIAAIVAAVVLTRDGDGERWRTEPVSRGDIAQRVSANGTLNPVSLVSVGTQVSGAVRALHVNFNDRVKKGQVLLELDDALLATQVRQSAANVLSAEASLELARSTEARQRELVARKFISERELEQAVQVRRSAEAALAVARAQADRDRVNLAYAVIRSPIDGIVIDRVVDVGQTVAASFQTPTLIKIAGDLRQMQIDTSFAEADIGNVRVGQPARFTVDAFPDRQFSGRVDQIRLNPTNQQNVVTYNVVIAVANPDEELLPGMTATVTLVVAERKDVLRVPNAALRFRPPGDAAATGAASEGAARRDGARAGRETEAGARATSGESVRSGTVHLAVDGKAQALRVQLGISDGRFSEVLAVDGGEALAEGSTVIVGEAGAATVKAQPQRLRMF